jgi:hypothetical protein
MVWRCMSLQGWIRFARMDLKCDTIEIFLFYKSTLEENPI